MAPFFPAGMYAREQVKFDRSGWICVFCIIERETDKNHRVVSFGGGGSIRVRDQRWETVIIIVYADLVRVIMCAMEKILIPSQERS